jgi:hypothetical protein
VTSNERANLQQAFRRKFLGANGGIDVADELIDGVVYRVRASSSYQSKVGQGARACKK